MAKSKVFWITRDEGDNRDYEIWPYKEYPQQNVLGEYSCRAPFRCCCDEFEKLTGITLAPGQRVKARLVIKE